MLFICTLERTTKCYCNSLMRHVSSTNLMLISLASFTLLSSTVFLGTEVFFFSALCDFRFDKVMTFGFLCSN